MELQQNITYGCKHYNRKCKFFTNCCNKIFDCRLCHDEHFENTKNQHILNRHTITHIICSICNEKQLVSNECIKCKITFGEYFCKICNLFDDDTSKQQYHCDKCGICRVGGKENFYHCDTCNSCINNDLKDNHVCIENSFHNTCPICCEPIFNSVKNITMLKCGHTIHIECFKEMLQEGTFSSLRCPYCNKSTIDCDHIFKYLQQEIDNTPMPEDLNYNVKILCNDCLKESETKFHIIGHKCNDCGSYNTRRSD